MPILANPMPISGQSVTSYVVNHRTSPLYGMVPSLLGGRNVRNNTRSASTCGQSRTSPWPILCQSRTNPVSVHVNLLSIWGHSKVNIPVQRPFSNQPILAKPCQSANPVPIRANLCQSDANQPIPGQSANPRPIRQSGANPMSLLRPFPHLT